VLEPKSCKEGGQHVRGCAQSPSVRIYLLAQINCRTHLKTEPIASCRWIVWRWSCRRCARRAWADNGFAPSSQVARHWRLQAHTTTGESTAPPSTGPRVMHDMLWLCASIVSDLQYIEEALWVMHRLLGPWFRSRC
jgi:hypothetical protein